MHFQGLNARLLVIRDCHHTELPAGLAPSIFIDDLDFLVDVQYTGHFGFEVRIPFLHVVSNFVRSQYRALPQDLVEFRTASHGSSTGCPAATQCWRM